MMEVEELDIEVHGYRSSRNVKARGFCNSRDVLYDETVYAYLGSSGEAINIVTLNSSDPEERNAWETGLTKEQAIAFALHLLSLAREMD